MKIRLLLLTIVLFCLSIITLVTGTYNISFGELINTFTLTANNQTEMVIYSFRLPRLIVVIFCGIALALSGLILQAVSKNPLADPGIVGVNAGSGLGVVIYIGFLSQTLSHHIYLLPLMSFVGGVITVIVVFTLSFVRHQFKSQIFILIGIATAMGMTGFVYLFTAMFDRRQMMMLNQYFAGNIIGDTWTFVIISVPLIVFLIGLVYMCQRQITMVELDDELLINLGMNVYKTKIFLLIISALLSSIAVSIVGAISFLGLLAPHMSRMLVKSTMKYHILYTAFIGAILLTLADLLGKLMLAPMIIPTGIVVSIIGGPYFVYLLYKMK